MTIPSAVLRRALLAMIASLASIAGVLSIVPAASADSAPANPANPATPVTASADSLPTVQIDGVAWSQVVVGNTVYVAGEFTTARPAGAAPGTQTTPRNNLLAYDIRTGALITSFAPNLNAQALVVKASPDGSRIYVGGDFTVADGEPRYRVAAYSTATGALIPSFAPIVGAQVRGLAVSDTAVYVGGHFAGVGPNGETPRARLAAFSTEDGSILPWAPVSGVGKNANGSTAVSSSIDALVVAPGGAKIIAAGRFGKMNGVATSGVAALDPVSGATLPWAIGQIITNQGDNSSINSLSVDADTVYGTGYDFYGPGNLEGTFAANPDTGAIKWIQECHGDHYSAFSMANVIYTTSHTHVCSNIGGFPETNPRTHHNATAFSKAATGVVGNATIGNNNFTGKPAPALLTWFPPFAGGTYTGQGQAGWNVAGNSEYIVYGGEFPVVNNKYQQGLVRFPIPSLAPNQMGPDLVGNNLNPTLSFQGNKTIRVTWRAIKDRDNETLTYTVIRNNVIVANRTTVTAKFWSLPSIVFNDTNRGGGTYSYQIYASDPWGNQVAGSKVNITIGGTPEPPPAPFPIVDDHFERTAASGLGIADVGGPWTPSGSMYDWSVTGGVARAANLQTYTRSAYLNGTSARDLAIQASVSLTQPATGSGTFAYVVGRHVGTNDYRARLRFDAPGTVSLALTRAVSGAETVLATVPLAGVSYAPGQIMLVRFEMEGNGTTDLRAKAWKAGTAEPAGWQVTAQDSTAALQAPGSVGIMTYLFASATVVPQTRFDDLWAGQVGTAPVPANVAPVANFSTLANELVVDFNAGSSSDFDGTITNYAWNFGDGGTSSGASPTVQHAFPSAGTYNVTLTVTDDDLATGAVTKPVMVSVAPPPALASDAFERTVVNGLGSADVGGPYTLFGPASVYAVNGGSAAMTTNPGITGTGYLNSVSLTNIAAQVGAAVNPTGSGAGYFLQVIGRHVGTNDYRVKVRVFATGAVQVQLTRLVNNVETVLQTVQIAGLTLVNGDVLQIRLDLSGTSPTTVRAKVWKSGTAEPVGWQASVTDSTAELQGAGGVGISTYLAASASGPMVTRFDNFWVGAAGTGPPA